MESKNVLSIWLVVGISLLVNGVLILGAGLYELVYPPVNKVALYEYHAGIWLGAVLTLVGAFYCIRFSPKREQAAAQPTEVAKEVHV